MKDRLVWLLDRFELRAKVFQSGVLLCNAAFQAREGLGYIHVLQRGSVELTHADGAREVIDQPSVFFFMRPARHALKPGGKGTSMVCASFEFGLGEGNPLLGALPGMMKIPLNEMPALDLTMRQLFGEAAEAHCGQQAILDRLCEVSLVLILRNLMDQRLLDVGLLAGLADRRLMHALNAMHEAPAESWTLDRLALKAGMSRARFAVHFKKVVGMTPGSYLADWRVGLAQTLLLKGKPLKSVAWDVGYGSPSALSRAFTALRGMPPGRWLKERRG